MASYFSSTDDHLVVHAGNKRKRSAPDITTSDPTANVKSDDKKHGRLDKVDDVLPDTNDRDDDNDDNQVPARLPTCTICMQPYIKRTYLQPCYHSYCFMCIRQWINIAPTCPLCKQGIDSLVYNIDERNNTFQEYVLADNISHNPLPDRPTETRLDRIAQLRHSVYHSLPGRVFDNPTYPPPQRHYAQLQYVTPELLPKAEIFATREVLAILGKPCDEYILSHIKALLMTPYNADRDKQQNQQQQQQRRSKIRSPSPLAVGPQMTMEHAGLLHELGGWLSIGDEPTDGDVLARRFIKELMAFLRSGLDYWTFVSRVEYPEED